MTWWPDGNGWGVDRDAPPAAGLQGTRVSGLPYRAAIPSHREHASLTWWATAARTVKGGWVKGDNDDGSLGLVGALGSCHEHRVAPLPCSDRDRDRHAGPRTFGRLGVQAGGAVGCADLGRTLPARGNL